MFLPLGLLFRVSISLGAQLGEVGSKKRARNEVFSKRPSLSVSRRSIPHASLVFFSSLSLLRSLALFFTSIFRVLSTASI